VERLVIRLRGVRFGYRAESPVLDGIDLDVPPGLTLLLGPNGSGKSTLLKIAAGVEKPDGGSVEIDGADPWREEVRARRRLAYVPEQPDLTPYATLQEVMRLVCRLREVDEARAPEALAAVGMAGLERRSIRELSMGQRRRALMAAARIGEPRVLILDEPLEAVDRSMRDATLEWVEAHRAAGATLLVATHELEPFAATAARVVGVRAGRARVHEPLPAPQDERIALLEAMARGK
jgi:ABC-2 type transport system ATP-binding protein